MGHTVVDSVSAQSAVQFEEWEAFHLQSKRKHSTDEIKTSNDLY